MSRSDDFYVGYLDTAPPALAAFVKGRVRLTVLGALAVALALLLSMSAFRTSNFEFGTERTFEGVLVESPVPCLLVDRPGDTGSGQGARSRYLLVAFGKFGAHEEVRGLDGKRVRLSGTLVYHEDRTMIELVSGSIETLDDMTGASSFDTNLGEQTLVGEIVDSKCFLGVMKPGNLKPHRACAVRCISGGVPPVLVVRSADGNARYYVLVGEDGSALNEAVLDRIAEPVRVTGSVIRRDDLDFLHASADAIERLDS